MGRAVMWLFAGAVIFAVLVLAVVPGAFRDLSAVGELAMFAAVAGVPGIVLLVILALRRRSSAAEDPEL